MRCPYCSSDDLKVVDKRDSEDAIRRRRECLKCSKRFTTHEEIVPIEITVIKSDGRREAFSEEKLRKGILLAVEKRPVTEGQVDKIIHSIEGYIRKQAKKEISSQKVGDLVMAKLKRIDHVAYIRFASVCKRFTDVNMFEKEIQAIKR